MNLERVSRRVGLPAHVLRPELEAMVGDGDVEVLSPIPGRGPRHRHAAPSDQTRHYRLIRPSDGRYAWQQEVLRQWEPAWVCWRPTPVCSAS